MSARARRDWILVPLLSFVTAFAILAAAEGISRSLFPASPSSSPDCLVLKDRTRGVQAIPNCVCWHKTFESDSVEYRFNSCGHRAGIECSPKRPGNYRIVLVGTSVAEGVRVPREESFAALLPKELSKATGRKVEIYNEALEWCTPHVLDIRFRDVLSAQPDLILWAFTPFDIEQAAVVAPTSVFQGGAGPEGKDGVSAQGWRRFTAPFGAITVPAAVSRGWTRMERAIARRSRTALVLQHALYQSESLYVNQYLRGEGATYMRAKPTPEWLSQLQQFEFYAADVEEQARRAGIPLAAIAIPERAEAAMISAGTWPEDFDPYLFGEQVRHVIERHGGQYIDILQGFRNISHAERYYFPVDGHPNQGGHHILSKLLAAGLIRAGLPR
jgi:hypothetical protein